MMIFDSKTDTTFWRSEGRRPLRPDSPSSISVDTFPQLGRAAMLFCCSGGFYLLSIVVRILNHKGQALSGKPASDESRLKYLFPPLGFLISIALLLSQS